MRCSNSKCGIDIKAPLDLYNGDMACPRCRKKIELISGEMQLTDNNRELYELAELWYSYGLSLSIGNSVPEAVRDIGLGSAAMIDNALGLTMEASMLGHPEARWRLGFFYDKDYAESDKTEAVRTRLAGKYYSSIFESNSREFTGYGKDETDALKHRAARDFIKMLSLADKNEREYFSREREVALTFLTEDERTEVNMPEKTDAESFKALAALFSSDVRAPLFGMFVSDAESMPEIAQTIRDLRGYQLSETRFCIIPLENEAGNIPVSYREVVFPTNDVLDDEISRAIKGGCGRVAIFFVNVSGKHVKRPKIKSIFDYVIQSKRDVNITRFDVIMSQLAGRRAITFYDDDIIFCNKSNATAGFDALISRLGTEN